MNRTQLTIAGIVMTTALSIAQPESPYMMATMGWFPGGLHNTPLRLVVPHPGDGGFVTTMTPAEAKDVYGIVGTGIDGWHTYAEQEKNGIVLGEDGPGGASVVWNFRGPLGNVFTGGTATLTGEVVSPADNAPELLLAVGGKVKLTGGGSYWKTLQAVDTNGAAIAAFDPSKKGPQTVTAHIPTNAPRMLYVAAIRQKAKPGQNPVRLRITRLHVQPTYGLERGLWLTVARDDPLWNVGEPIEWTINSGGTDRPQNIAYRVCRLTDGEYKPLRTEHLSLGKHGSTKSDLSELQAGYYRLDLLDQRDMNRSLDMRHFVILRAQDPKLTHNESIFGAKQTYIATDIARRMGIKWMSGVILWAWAQDAPGAPMRIRTDWVNESIEAGIEPKVTIGTAPKWANGIGPGSAPPTEEHMKYWAAFCEEVARVFGKKVTWYETWNEPNNNNQLHIPGPWNLEERVAKAKQLQRVQYEAIREGNPDAKLMGGNYAGARADWATHWLTGPDSTLGYQQAMSGHPYCALLKEKNNAPEPLVPKVLAFRKAMDEHGARDQFTFWTEFGFDMKHVQEDQQARLNARQFTMIQAYRDVLKTKAAFVFTFNPKYGHAILRPNRGVGPWNHRLRLSVGAIATTASVLAGTTPAERHSDYPDTIRLYEFRKDTQRRFAAWATEDSETHQVTIPVEKETPAVLVELLGGETPIALQPGQPINLPTNGDPVFLMLRE